MKSYGITTALVIILVIFLFACGAVLVSAQGGTGREPPAPPPKKSKPSARTSGTSSRPLPRSRTNQAGIEFVLIPPGSFMMGSIKDDSEKPVHKVTIDYSFYLGRYEVTQAQWQAVMGTNPSYFKGDNLPVESVSWDDAIAFIARLNAQNDGFIYRLPTEAEWEYACRAGTTGDYGGDLDAMAWYGNNSGRGRLDAAEIFRTDYQNYFKRIRENGGQTHAVGTKLPNSFGLFDMHGNVWEWCQDWYHGSYNGAPTDGSAWLSGRQNQDRMLRGGSCDGYATSLRAAGRVADAPSDRGDGSGDGLDGFRVVAVVRTQ
jgi:formylglycine-generating enzyme required for sulfatase activity